jgi:hypothetical protein
MKVLSPMAVSRASFARCLPPQAALFGMALLCHGRSSSARIPGSVPTTLASSGFRMGEAFAKPIAFPSAGAGCIGSCTRITPAAVPRGGCRRPSVAEGSGSGATRAERAVRVINFEDPRIPTSLREALASYEARIRVTKPSRAARTARRPWMALPRARNNARRCAQSERSRTRGPCDAPSLAVPRRVSAAQRHKGLRRNASFYGRSRHCSSCAFARSEPFLGSAAIHDDAGSARWRLSRHGPSGAHFRDGYSDLDPKGKATSSAHPRRDVVFLLPAADGGRARFGQSERFRGVDASRAV